MIMSNVQIVQIKYCSLFSVITRCWAPGVLAAWRGVQWPSVETQDTRRDGHRTASELRCYIWRQVLATLLADHPVCHSCVSPPPQQTASIIHVSPSSVYVIFLPIPPGGQNTSGAGPGLFRQNAYKESRVAVCAVESSRGGTEDKPR